MAPHVPPLSEFIDLEQRRVAGRHGFPPLTGAVTVAVYENKVSGYLTLTIRISEDLAEKYRLAEGEKMVCHIHPDQRHLALRPGKGKGSALFRPKGSRSLVYQTTLSDGTLTPQRATAATLEEIDGAVVISVVA